MPSTSFPPARARPSPAVARIATTVVAPRNFGKCPCTQAARPMWDLSAPRRRGCAVAGPPCCRREERTVDRQPSTSGPGRAERRRRAWRQGQCDHPGGSRRLADITGSTVAGTAAALNTNPGLPRSPRAPAEIGQTQLVGGAIAVAAAARAAALRRAQARQQRLGKESRAKRILRTRVVVAAFDQAVTTRLRQVAGARAAVRITVDTGRATVPDLSAAARAPGRGAQCHHRHEEPTATRDDAPCTQKHEAHLVPYRA
jgi:hypothetical protein